MTVMTTCLPILFILTILHNASNVSGLGSVIKRRYRHISAHKTWHEAQDHCNTKYNGLATVFKKSDENQMQITKYLAWIHLFGSTPRKNILTCSTATFNSTMAQTNDKSPLVIYWQHWISEHRCEQRYFFICQDKNDHSKYTFIPLSKTWFEAQAYCREHHSDLATFPTNSSLNILTYQNFPAWIGLHRDADTWRWNTSSSNYQNWESSTADDGSCVSISAITKKMSRRKCNDHFPFVCMKNNIVVVKENKTWEEALEHCRELTVAPDTLHCYDLVSVQPGDDQNYLMKMVNEAGIEKVWVALRFLSGYWQWMNKADMLYTDLPECPVGWKECGVISTTNWTTVELQDCTEKMNFVCYRKFT